MIITFFDRSAEMVDAYRKRFQKASDVKFFQGDFTNLPGEYDAIVSPANSFGFMDGGIDLAYSRYLGWHVQERLQEVINSAYNGELLVGQAVAVFTDHPQFKSLLAAPTMRIPMRIGNTVNVYLAMKAIVRAVITYGFKSIAIPGLGTGVGNVPSAICAKQVGVALVHGLTKDTHTTLHGAYDFHQWLMEDTE